MKEVILSSLKLNELQDIAQQILSEATHLGASQAEVSIGVNKGFSVTARDTEVENVEYHQDKIVEVTVYKGQRSGSASITDIRKTAIRSAVEAACHIATFTDEDKAAGLAAKEELAFHYPQLKLSYPWSLSVPDAIQMACECERQALAYDKRIISAESVGITTAEGWHVYANTEGFIGAFPFTRHEMNCLLIAKEGEEMQRDYSYTLSANPTELVTTTHLAHEAAKRTIARLGGRTLGTMKIPVIFIAEEARTLWGHFVAAISGGNLYRKSSFLIDHLDKNIFPAFMHIQENPHWEGALGSAPFDSDGVSTRANVFVEEGVLKQYALGVYAARKLGMKTTGNAGGVHNLSISTGDKDLKALIKTMDTGLLITEMMGQGVNLVTGDYSRGAVGFWIEKGEIQYPVHEITVAGRLQDIYARIAEVGTDIDKRGNIRTGSVLIEEMMIAGQG